MTALAALIAVCVAAQDTAEISMLARAGDPKAMVRLGVEKLKSPRSAAVLGEAYALFESSAAKGEAEAFYHLGVMHERGLHVDIDLVRAMECFEKAAALGSADGAHRMAVAHFNGLGAAKDPKLSVQFWTVAAKKKHAEAQFWLSLCHYEGIGVEPDALVARDWLQRAAEAGHSEAQYRMALTCESYDAVGKVHWLRLSASQGNMMACYRLAGCMLQGDGVMSDKTLSLALYFLAASYGHKDSLEITNDREWERHGISRIHAEAAARSIRSQIDAGRPPLELGEGWSSGQPSASDRRKPGSRSSVPTSSSGSGLIFTEQGHCFTNYHVVMNGSRHSVRLISSERPIPADLVAFDKGSDLAVLKLREWAPADSGIGRPPSLVSAQSARVGMRVFTFGHPFAGALSSEPKYTSGDISSLRGMRDDDDLIQISVPVQPGNSGGPLALEDGRVVGIVVSKIGMEFVLSKYGSLAENVNFAVKSDRLLDLLRKEGIRIPSDAKTEHDPVDQIRRFTVQILSTR